MGFRDDEVYAALTRALEHLNDATRAVREAEAAMMQPDPAASSEDYGGCSGELCAHVEPPIYRWRPGEDDGWAGYTTDAASLPANAQCERWEPTAQEWQPFSAWTEYFHREGQNP